jgi:hypothetical protein
MEPYLVAQGTIYPRGRIQSVMIKGINPKQSIFLLPTHRLDTTISDAVPAVIGNNVQKSQYRQG